MSSSRFEEKGMHCQRCQGEDLVKAGFDRCRGQIYGCSSCGRRHTCRSPSAFSGYRFPDEIIALAVRWYLRFRLPHADVAELLAERGSHVDPSTVFDCVQRFAPLYEAAARPYRHRVGQRWSIDETYVRIAPHSQVVETLEDSFSVRHFETQDSRICLY